MPVRPCPAGRSYSREKAKALRPKVVPTVMVRERPSPPHAGAVASPPILKRRRSKRVSMVKLDPELLPPPPPPPPMSRAKPPLKKKYLPPFDSSATPISSRNRETVLKNRISIPSGEEIDEGGWIWPRYQPTSR